MIRCKANASRDSGKMFSGTKMRRSDAFLLFSILNTMFVEATGCRATRAW